MRKWFIALACALTLSAAVAFLPLGGKSFGKVQRPEWQTIKVERESLSDATVAAGTVKLKVGAEVKVGSQISGVVSRLNVNVGDHVEKGDLLALIDDSALRAQVGTLQADVDAAVAEMQYTEGQLERYVHLAKAIAPIDVDKTRRDLAVQRARVAQAEARLHEAKIKLGYTRIEAPVAGTIASVSTYQGETVAASLAAPTFTTIVDLSRIEVHAFVDETDIGKVTVGQKVDFRVDSFPNQELSGVVQAIYPGAQLVNNVVNYVVIIDIPDTHGLLIRPEMTAHVNFTLVRRDDAPSLPRSAVFAKSGQQYVIVATPTGWSEKPVKTGMRTVQRVEILSGLQPTDSVLADAQLWVANEERHD